VTDDLSPSQHASLDALRASRGACPTAETLVDYEGLGEAGRAQHPQHAHIQICSRCQLTLLHMAEPAPASSTLRWALPLAAVAVLGAALTLVDRLTPGVAPNGDTVRGTEIQLTAPLGAVDMVREFSWQSPIRADRYRVIVRQGSKVVWQTEANALSVAPPPAGVLQRDVQYEWQVEAIDREGNVRLTSPSQSFVNY
jgi:hypothetical protein